MDTYRPVRAVTVHTSVSKLAFLGGSALVSGVQLHDDVIILTDYTAAMIRFPRSGLLPTFPDAIAISVPGTTTPTQEASAHVVPCCCDSTCYLTLTQNRTTSLGVSGMMCVVQIAVPVLPWAIYCSL